MRLAGGEDDKDDEDDTAFAPVEISSFSFRGMCQRGGRCMQMSIEWHGGEGGVGMRNGNLFALCLHEGWDVCALCCVCLSNPHGALGVILKFRHLCQDIDGFSRKEK